MKKMTSASSFKRKSESWILLWSNVSAARPFQALLCPYRPLSLRLRRQSLQSNCALILSAIMPPKWMCSLVTSS
eukprot:1130021-Prorocentrum_lima.AAC.1